MHILSRIFVLFSLLLTVSLISCNPAKPKVKSPVDDFEAYHRDLIFERYDVAAKRIAPASRFEWLNALRSQGIRFAEIQIQSTEECTDEPTSSSNTATSSALDVADAKSTDERQEPTPCVRIFSIVQWYSNAAPTLKTSHVTTTWNYDYETKTWNIVEQNERQ